MQILYLQLRSSFNSIQVFTMSYTTFLSHLHLVPLPAYQLWLARLSLSITVMSIYGQLLTNHTMEMYNCQFDWNTATVTPIACNSAVPDTASLQSTYWDTDTHGQSEDNIHVQNRYGVEFVVLMTKIS